MASCERRRVSKKRRRASSRSPHRMNVVIPENLKPGDTFEVSVPVAIPTVAAIPAAPPPPRTPITEAEALCYNLRHSVMCYAILDACLAFLNIFLAYVFWWYCSGVLRFDLSTSGCRERPRRDVSPRRQALWALVRLLIANIVGKFAQLLQTIGRQRMSEVEQQGRRAVLVYY